MVSLAPGLFDPQPIVSAFAGIDGNVLAARGAFTLRDFQAEDVAATLAAFEAGKRGVVCRWATGLGKSVYCAELARVLCSRGRVLIVVDVTNLAADLVRTIHSHTGKMPGVLTGDLKEGWRRGKIVVATKQTLCAGGEGKEFYRTLNPNDFAAVGVDEGETSIADQYAAMLKHFSTGNSALVMFTCTATPFRGDGRGMGEVYDHIEPGAGKLNRNMPWGRDNGWLVPWRQGFVRVSLDFSTLKVRKGADGEKDYADTDLIQMLENEKTLRELAIGIDAAAKGEPSIVICPNSVEFAKKLDQHLNAVRPGSAQAIYGEQGQRADDLMAAFKRGEYPYVTSVNKLYKGFDFCGVRHVFMARKTRSRRLGEQAAGRGARPLAQVRPELNHAADAEARRQIIAASTKPHFVFWDVVGLHPSVKDFGLCDIELSLEGDEAVSRAKRKMLNKLTGSHDPASDTHDPAEAIRSAKKEMADEARKREDFERFRRQRISVNGHVDIEVTDDLRIGGGEHEMPNQVEGDPASAKQINLLIALGVKPATAEKCSRRQAGAMITSYTRKGTRPDWSRLRQPRHILNGDAAPPLFRRCDLTAHPPSPWQRERLAKLRYNGTPPVSYDAAVRLIRQIESQRRGAA